MYKFMKHILKIATAGSILLSSQFALAQSAAPIGDAAIQSYSIDGLLQRYPKGSIQSAEASDSALAAVEEARTRVAARFTAEQKACYPQFFTTSCLNKVIERRRVDLSMIRPIEIEANAYTRHAKVVERDRKLAEKAAEDEGKAALRPAPGQEKADAAGQAIADEQTAASKKAQRKVQADAYARKIAENADKQRRLKEKEQAGAQERAANIARYKEKVRESEERQKEVAEKKAEKERERAAKSASGQHLPDVK